jgi:hypothetical protein
MVRRRADEKGLTLNPQKAQAEIRPWHYISDLRDDIADESALARTAAPLTPQGAAVVAPTAARDRYAVGVQAGGRDRSKQ